MSMQNRPMYSDGVLIGNWVADLAIKDNIITKVAPEEEIDYSQFKRESREADYRYNKLNANENNIAILLLGDKFVKCGNYTTTNDLVYNHLPKPLCGPDKRRYTRSKESCYTEKDLTDCYGNLTGWGLRGCKRQEWEHSRAPDGFATLYNDTYLPPPPGWNVNTAERHARNMQFTKTFRYKMTRPLEKSTKQPSPSTGPS